MKETFSIKGNRIGAGRPLVCVPIVEAEGRDIIKAAEELSQTPVEMAEWRIDWFEEAVSQEAVCRMGAKLAEILERQILLCTFRSKRQGGEKEIAREAYKNLLLKLAQTGCTDMIDVEVCELREPGLLIRELQQSGTRVIASDHNFTGTPDTEIMIEKLLYMKKLGADVAKLAVMPNQKTDVLRLLEATVQVREQEPEYPLITMAMGKSGIISRISGEVFGSCVTFGSAGKASAPGQMPFTALVDIRNKISESLEA